MDQARDAELWAAYFVNDFHFQRAPTYKTNEFYGFFKGSNRNWWVNKDHKFELVYLVYKTDHWIWNFWMFTPSVIFMFPMLSPLALSSVFFSN